MLSAGVGDHSNGRARDAHERGNLAPAVCAHLDDGKLIGGLETQQSQRHADVIVQVAPGGQAGTRLREDGRGHLLRGGLAVAAGDADDRDGELIPPRVTECLESQLRVGYDNLRQRNILHGVNDRAGRARGVRRVDEFVRVEAGAPERHEQLTPREGSGVARNAKEGLVGPLQHAATGCREIGEGSLHAPPLLANSSWTTD